MRVAASAVEHVTQEGESGVNRTRAHLCPIPLHMEEAMLRATGVGAGDVDGAGREAVGRARARHARRRQSDGGTKEAARTLRRLPP